MNNTNKTKISGQSLRLAKRATERLIQCLAVPGSHGSWT